MQNSANLANTFDSMLYLFMLIVPILTMRLLSEERRARTDQLLLLTSPLPLSSIVVGKFLAACTVLLVSLSLMGVYALIAARYGTVYPLTMLSNYLGFLLMGCCYIAVGVFISGLTDSPATAAILTVGVNFLLQVAEVMGPQIAAPYLSFLRTAFSWLSLYRRYDAFAAGLISPANLLYFASFCGVMLLLTVQWMQRRRWAEK